VSFFTFFIFLLFSNTFFHGAYSLSRVCDTFTFLRKIKAPHSKITVVKDHTGTFIIKQRDARSVAAQGMTVVEAWATHIARSLSIPGNDVVMIPASVPCKYKIFNDAPATLHTFVPGKELDTLGLPKNFTLNQRCKASSSKGGLTLEVIKSMTLHRDLPPLLAVDTFVNNNNRHGGNVLYDDSTDRFYAIDFGAALRFNMCRKTAQNIKELLGHSFTQKEKMALASYRDTLKKLIGLYTPQKLEQLFQQYVENAGLSAKYLLGEEEKQEFKAYKKGRKRLIFESYTAAQELVGLLDKLLTKR
jgi:hypothetical protein